MSKGIEVVKQYIVDTQADTEQATEIAQHFAEMSDETFAFYLRYTLMQSSISKKKLAEIDNAVKNVCGAEVVENA